MRTRSNLGVLTHYVTTSTEKPNTNSINLSNSINAVLFQASMQMLSQHWNRRVLHPQGRLRCIRIDPKRCLRCGLCSSNGVCSRTDCLWHCLWCRWRSVRLQRVWWRPLRCIRWPGPLRPGQKRWRSNGAPLRCSSRSSNVCCSSMPCGSRLSSSEQQRARTRSSWSRRGSSC